MDNDWIAIPLIIIGGFLVVILLAVAITTASYIITDPPICYSRGQSLELKTEWGFWQGCIYTLKDGTKLTSTQFDNYYRINQKQ